MHSLLLAASLSLLTQSVPTPEESLGRPLGRDFELADWKETATYFRALGAASPRVDVSVVGETTEGREFLLAVISAEENLARLDELRGYAATLADPRGREEAELERAVTQGKVFLFVSCAMHATETAAPQFGMEFAHRLATEEGEFWDAARREVVVLLAPSLNPDGQDHVVDWYRRTVGTPFEASGLTKLYQLYAGHDNNRDWFMLSQAETRITTELLYKEWHPQVYWDVHQQGSRRERFFVPPFRDPLNPNLEPSIITGIDLLGTRALHDLTTEGFTGVSTGVSYDMWWNGGNRNVPVRHNIIGLLTEAASVRIATPVFLPRSELSPPRGLESYAPSNRFPDPWPGGWWRIRDIIEYEHAFGRSILGSLAREPELFRRGALIAAQRAIAEGVNDTPRAWILPATNRDRSAVRRLCDALLRTGVELERATEDFEADGRTWPAGSLVIRRAQPYGAYVKDLFEVQRYPEGAPPYDVAGWTLPLLLGVERVAVVETLDVAGEPVRDASAAVTSFAGREGTHVRNSDSWTLAFRRLEEGVPVGLTTAGEGDEPRADAGRFVSGSVDPERQLVVEEPPRIGLYSPWSGSMDEGWMRYVFDTFGVPYVRVRNETINAGDLARHVDVLVIPSISGRQLDGGRTPGSAPSEYTGGLAPEGAVAVEEFVRTGGRVVTVGSSSAWLIRLLHLPLVDTTRGEDAKDFSCPGSVLRTIPADAPLCTALPPSVPVFFSRSSAWRLMTSKERDEARVETHRDDPETLLRYARTRTLLSGWMKGEDAIAGRSAWVRATHGEGEVHLFGFRPQYRSWSQAAFTLLFRAILLPAE